MFSPTVSTSLPKPRTVPQLVLKTTARAEARMRMTVRLSDVFMAFIGRFQVEISFMMNLPPWGETLPQRPSIWRAMMSRR